MLSIGCQQLESMPWTLLFGIALDRYSLRWLPGCLARVNLPLLFIHNSSFRAGFHGCDSTNHDRYVPPPRQEEPAPPSAYRPRSPPRPPRRGCNGGKCHKKRLGKRGLEEDFGTCPTPKAVFNTLSKGSNSFNRTQFLSHFESLDPNYDSFVYESAFNRMDVNEDGQVTFDEMINNRADSNWVILDVYRLSFRINQLI